MILVTGGMGFIGLHTAAALAGAGEEVVITRFRQVRAAEFLDGYLASGQVKVAAMDVSDPFSVLEAVAANKVDSIVHLAVPALGGLPVGREIEVNLGGLRHVLEAARATGVSRLTLASSVAVYAGTGDGPWREEDRLPLASPSPTSAFKKAEEILALHYAQRTGLDVACVRIGVVYGPLYHSMSNLPSRLVHSAARPATALPPRPAVPGARTDLADLIYVGDCAAGLRHAHLAPNRPHHVYNLGGGRAVGDDEVAEAVERAVPGWRRPEPAPDAVAVGSDRYMDMARIGELGFKPGYGINEGIAEYVEWVKAHES